MIAATGGEKVVGNTMAAMSSALPSVLIQGLEDRVWN
jgi:hypothetical protein